jgi:hypothetical protein
MRIVPKNVVNEWMGCKVFFTSKAWKMKPEPGFRRRKKALSASAERALNLNCSFFPG